MSPTCTWKQFDKEIHSISRIDPCTEIAFSHTRGAMRCSQPSKHEPAPHGIFVASSSAKGRKFHCTPTKAEGKVHALKMHNAIMEQDSAH